MTNASQLLNVDEERLIAKMTDYLRRLIAEKKVNGVVGGLSGGVDSAGAFQLIGALPRRKVRPCHVSIRPR
jgi:NH3-dependent NAD+ synthetase